MGRLRPDLVVNDLPMLVTMLGAVSDYVGPEDTELWQRYLVLFLDGLAAARAWWTPLGHPPSQTVVDSAMTKCPDQPAQTYAGSGSPSSTAKWSM